MQPVAQEIASEMGDLLAQLKAIGFEAVDSRYDAHAFGNFFVDFDRSGRRFRLIKDRSQFIVEADSSELQRSGLWRAFDSREEFVATLLSWLKE